MTTQLVIANTSAKWLRDPSNTERWHYTHDLVLRDAKGDTYILRLRGARAGLHVGKRVHVDVVDGVLLKRTFRLV